MIKNVRKMICFHMHSIYIKVIMKKEKSHFINVYQPLPTKTTQCNQHILPNLSSILHDRAAFLK